MKIWLIKAGGSRQKLEWQGDKWRQPISVDHLIHPHCDELLPEAVKFIEEITPIHHRHNALALLLVGAGIGALVGSVMENNWAIPLVTITFAIMMSIGLDSASNGTMMLARATMDDGRTIAISYPHEERDNVMNTFVHARIETIDEMPAQSLTGHERYHLAQIRIGIVVAASAITMLLSTKLLDKEGGYLPIIALAAISLFTLTGLIVQIRHMVKNQSNRTAANTRHQEQSGNILDRRQTQVEPQPEKG